MSYTKITTLEINMANTLADVMGEFYILTHDQDIIYPLHDDMIAAGAFVELEDGLQAWVSSVVYDRPETLQTDLMTIAIALKDGEPWVKQNGQHVAVAFWHGMFPDALATLTVNCARKALMMVALGEPQLQIAIDPVGDDGIPERDAIPMNDKDSRSIRFVALAANQIAAPAGDVL